MAQKDVMSPIDLTDLAEFEQEWVALDKDRKIQGHARTLASLRESLGPAAGDYRYFFVPSTQVGFSGLA